MEETLKLQLEAFAKLEQLDAMIKKLEVIDKEVKDLNKAIKQTDKVLEALNKGNTFAKITAQVSTLKLALSGVRTIGGAIGTVFSKLYDAGKYFFEEVVDAAQFKQNTLVSFETFLGNKKDADEEFANILKIAQKTPADTEELVNVTRLLLQAGFKRNEMDTLRAMAADVQALSGSNETMKEFTIAISKIRGQGKLDANDRQSLLNAGIGADELNKELAVLLKIKGTEKQITAEVKKRQEAGKIDAATAIKAAQNALKNRLGEGMLGEYAIKMASESLSGAVSNFRNAFKDTLKSLDFNNSPGIKAYAKFLNNVTEEIGSKEFKSAIKGIMEELFGGFERLDKKTINSFFMNTIIPGLKHIKAVIREMWDFIDKIFKGGGILSGSFWMTMIKGMGKALYYVGLIIGKGLRVAIRGGHDDADAEIRKIEEAENKIKEDQATIDSVRTQTPLPVEGFKPVEGYNYVGGNTTVNVEVNANTNASPKEIADATTLAAVKAMSSKARNEARMKGRSK